MNRPNRVEHFNIETVVELAPAVAGAQTADGSLVLRDRLGPGIVREVGDEGALRVHWVTADLDAWVEAADVVSVGAGKRCIAMFECIPQGGRIPRGHKLVTRAGLTHNWTVEMLPGNVIRTVRSDGCSWTFDWNRVFDRVEPHGTVLEYPLAEDDHAEALAVAELSTT